MVVQTWSHIYSIPETSRPGRQDIFPDGFQIGFLQNCLS